MVPADMLSTNASGIHRFRTDGRQLGNIVIKRQGPDNGVPGKLSTRRRHKPLPCHFFDNASHAAEPTITARSPDSTIAGKGK